MNREQQLIRDQIAVNGCDSVGMVWVDGIPVGDHLLVHTWRERWTVTHRPTGCYIDHMPDGHSALRLAHRIVQDGYEIGEAYDRQAVEDIRGLAEKMRWDMAAEDVQAIGGRQQERAA